jgi:hypothetical protein
MEKYINSKNNYIPMKLLKGAKMGRYYEKVKAYIRKVIPDDDVGEKEIMWKPLR